MPSPSLTEAAQVKSSQAHFCISSRWIFGGLLAACMSCAAARIRMMAAAWIFAAGYLDMICGPQGLRIGKAHCHKSASSNRTDRTEPPTVASSGISSLYFCNMPTLQLVKEALKALKDRNGSSAVAITKWIENEKKVGKITLPIIYC